MTVTHPATAKLFPWKCSHCRCRSVVPALVDYTTEVEHDGRAYAVTVAGLEVARCGHCGEMILDDAANRRISETFREQVGLLGPTQIREHRKALGLTQRQLAGADWDRRSHAVTVGNRGPDSAAGPGQAAQALLRLANGA